METPEQPSMADALGRLWVQFLPQLQERVTIIESANKALAAGTLSIDEQAAANSAAHKLAGVLGTFGLTRGTILAREAEVLYSGPQYTDPQAAPQLTEITSELKRMIHDHK